MHILILETVKTYTLLSMKAEVYHISLLKNNLNFPWPLPGVSVITVFLAVADWYIYLFYLLRSVLTVLSAQAMDRAHRIGQKKVVNVYRLIMRNTLEEKIMGYKTANFVFSSYWCMWCVLIGPIPWGHSGPLCHAMSLLSSLSMSMSWTSMRATVPLATSDEWAWGGSLWRMGPTFFKCLSFYYVTN